MNLKRMLALGALSLAAACTTPAAAGGPPGGDVVKPPPLATGPVTVRGGEQLQLKGATVTVDRVTYVNSPCPAGVQCIHSGIIKRVSVTVVHSGAPVQAGVNEGDAAVVDGVEVRVVSVGEGPQAVLEASLPVK